LCRAHHNIFEGSTDRVQILGNAVTFDHNHFESNVSQTEADLTLGAGTNNAIVIGNEFTGTFNYTVGDSHFVFGNKNTKFVQVGKAIINEMFGLSGDISPAQITANQNDYNPTSLSTSSVLRLNTDASRNITGLAGNTRSSHYFMV
jgi:hypothetical protein